MNEIKLSICIPTYNREAYLRSALERFTTYGFSFPYEIVISDNASTDDTTGMVQSFIARGLPIRYYRRPENGGPLANLTNAFTQARGEYVTYHADDDFLVAEGVEEVVRYLDDNADVVSCQTPWHLYDEVNDQDLSQFYYLDEDVKFDRQEFVEIFQFLYDKHIFPEIGIFRASALKFAWVPREICFYAFSHLAHFVDQGAVAFLKTPCYRSVAVSRIAPARQQTGVEDVMVSWDSYRGGLEYFLHVASRRGKLNMSEDAIAVYDQMCKIFVMYRMSVAVRLWVSRNDFIKAYEIYTRMALGGFGEHPEVVELRKSFPAMVGLQTLASHVNAVTDIRRLILVGVDDIDYIGTVLRDLGLSESIGIVADPGAHAPVCADETAIFCIDDAQRDDFLAQGYRENFIFTERELTQYVLI